MNGVSIHPSPPPPATILMPSKHVPDFNVFSHPTFVPLKLLLNWFTRYPNGYQAASTYFSKSPMLADCPYDGELSIVTAGTDFSSTNPCT